MSSDCHRISFDNGIKVEQEVSVNVYYSGDKYLLDFSENSTTKNLNIASIQNAELILDMDKVSGFNSLKTDSLGGVSGSNLKNIVANKINYSDIVIFNILPEIAVVHSKIGSFNNIEIDGVKRNKGAIVISTSDKQNYTTLTTLKDLYTRNIKVGKPNNILVKNNNSISVKGDAGVAGNIYSSDVFSIGDINLSNVVVGEVSYKDNIKIQDLTIGVVSTDIEMSSPDATNLVFKAEGTNFQIGMNNTATYSFGNNNTLILDKVNSSAGIGKNPSSNYTLDVNGTTTAKSIEAEKEIQIKASAQ